MVPMRQIEHMSHSRRLDCHLRSILLREDSKRRIEPSWAKWMNLTESIWGTPSETHSSVSRSQNRMILSGEQEARSLSAGWNSTREVCKCVLILLVSGSQETGVWWIINIRGMEVEWARIFVGHRIVGAKMNQRQRWENHREKWRWRQWAEKRNEETLQLKDDDECH